MFFNRRNLGKQDDIVIQDMKNLQNQKIFINILIFISPKKIIKDLNL